MQINIKSATANNTEQCGYRNLWVEVIRQTWFRACVGEQAAITFFTATGGMFSTLCLFLDLPEQQIREEVLNRKRNK
ncbi:hypothetical protein [Edaphobacter aggregans]|uniref:hypothetical protein n=1 Tax=Edaphobacter aggregans TaxID=570835 RepID=UPI0012FACC64|nr:hypothetical protein [Edaphobacter aggregans]